jgi:hypothetical protein
MCRTRPRYRRGPPVSGTALAGKVPLMVEYREKDTFNNGYREWEHRLFLVFVPSPGDDFYVRQSRLLEGERSSFVERDLLRGDLFEGGRGPLTAGR